MTFSSARRRADFAEPYVLTVASRRAPDAAAPRSLPSPPPPRPRTCPHCGERDPVDLVADACDGAWSWACAVCLAEVEPVSAPPKVWEREDDGEDEAPKPQRERASRSVEARVVAMARRRQPTAAIAEALDLHPETVKRIRRRYGITPPPRRTRRGWAGWGRRPRSAGRPAR